MIDTQSNTKTGLIPAPEYIKPLSIGVDDTLYAGVYGQDDSILAVDTAAGAVSVVFGLSPTYTLSGGYGGPTGMAVMTTYSNSGLHDDSLYVTVEGLRAPYASVGLVMVFDAQTLTLDDSVVVPERPSDVAILADDSAATDDSVYVSLMNNAYISVINARTNEVDDTIPTLGGSEGLAVDSARKLVYVAVDDEDVVQVINAATGSVDDTIPVGDNPKSVAVNQDGTVFVSNFGSGSVSVISYTGLGVFDVDTVSGIDSALGVAASPVIGGNAYVVSNLISTGSLKVISSSPPSPPAPDPVYPPGAPTEVAAVAADASAAVTWKAPAYVGSFPVTNYQVTSSPGGKVCLVQAPSLTCTVEGLTNGVSYTFQVKALNGAGWGANSEASNAVTPERSAQPSILITGSRDASNTGVIKVSGTTSGLTGKVVTPYLRFPGQSGFTAGTGTRTVDSAGTFTWERKTGKKVTLYFAHEAVESNRVTIQAR